MRYGPSGVFANVSLVLLVADLVLIHATILRSLSAFWEFPLSVQISSAGTAGLIGAALLSPGVDQARSRPTVWIAVAVLSWVTAAAIGDWAETDGILGARALPQWWYTIHADSSGASGFTFFSGQAVAGAVAGVGLALPIVFDRTRTLRRRTVHALVLTVVAALMWTAIFHARWVACRF